MSAHPELTGKPQPLSPGGLVPLAMPYNPVAVRIANNSTTTNGAFLIWWLYPDSTTPVNSANSLNSGSSQTVNPPPPDGQSASVACAVVFNTGSAPLAVNLHNDV